MSGSSRHQEGEGEDAGGNHEHEEFNKFDILKDAKRDQKLKDEMRIMMQAEFEEMKNVMLAPVMSVLPGRHSTDRESLSGLRHVTDGVWMTVI